MFAKNVWYFSKVKSRKSKVKNCRRLKLDQKKTGVLNIQKFRETYQKSYQKSLQKSLPKIIEVWNPCLKINWNFWHSTLYVENIPELLTFDGICQKYTRIFDIRRYMSLGYMASYVRDVHHIQVLAKNTLKNTLKQDRILWYF